MSLAIILTLAAAARCDRRTAEKALRNGPASIRTVRVREDVEAALCRLGIAFPQPRVDSAAK